MIVFNVNLFYIKLLRKVLGIFFFHALAGNLSHLENRKHIFAEHFVKCEADLFDASIFCFYF